LERPLTHQAGAARSAQDAWTLLRNWALEPRLLDTQGTEETVWLRRWAVDFAERCERLKVLDGPRLSEVLAQGFERGAVQAPERLTLIGFDELAPAQERLLEALEKRGTEVRRAGLPLSRPERAVRLALADAAAEIRSAVSWAVSRIAERPGGRVALIVPRLDEYRKAILACLEDRLEPARLLAGERPRRALYNLSLGPPLAEAPLIHEAIAWWRLATGVPQPLESLSRLLRSPFSAGAQEEVAAPGAPADGIGGLGRALSPLLQEC